MPCAHSEILRGANHDTRSSTQALPEKQKMDLSSKTAETHRSNIMRKLNLHSVSELVLFAIRNGIIQVAAGAIDSSTLSPVPEINCGLTFLRPYASAVGFTRTSQSQRSSTLHPHRGAPIDLAC
jgi:Bacterial regulatory proteins, luxR family